MADFELLKVQSASQLHENLEKLLKNKKYIESIVVDTYSEEIRVDLSKMANTFGNPDFRLKLRQGKGAEAKMLIDALKRAERPTLTQSEELFQMLEH